MDIVDNGRLYTMNEGGTLSCPTLRAGSLPNILGLESGRHFFRRDGNWPTFISEGWKVADIFFSWNGQLQILFFCQQNL